MKYLLPIWGAIVAAAAGAIPSATAAADPPGWTLAWSDEFDGPSG